MQKLIPHKGFTVNTDVDETKLQPTEVTFIKNTRVLINKKGSYGVKTPFQSNKLLVDLPLPDGYNLNQGCYECVETGELYYMNYNDKKSHGIYVIDSDTLAVSKVIVDPLLDFSDDPKHAVPEHRVALKVVYQTSEDGVRRVKEKHLIFTDGKGWQRWINVKAAIGSNGFDAVQFPYWNTFAPHFDRQEYIDYPTRPPMMCPIVKELPLEASDKGKNNLLFNKSIRFAIRFIYTDGRTTTVNKWSDPYSLKQTTCNQAGYGLSRCLEIEFPAGSAMVERAQILFKNNDGDWWLCETIDKFTNCGENSPEVIGEEYWKRINPWNDYKYNAERNTIKYTFCGDKECTQVSQPDINMFEQGIPLHSVAMCAPGDSILLCDNEYFYPNLPCDLLNNIQIDTTLPVEESCKQKMVKIKVYSVACRNSHYLTFAYFNGDDKTVKWGTNDVFKLFGNLILNLNEDDAKFFELNFADRKGFVCVLAGTPYYSEGKQMVVRPTGVIEEFEPIDVSSADQLELVKSIFEEGGYFIYQHEFTVPAGKYIARLVRHNASLDSDFRKTSTYVIGLANSKLKDPDVPSLPGSTVVTNVKEMEIDATAGDVNVWGNGRDLFYVFAPNDYSEGTNHRWRFIEGYVYESKDVKRGVELFKYNATEGFPELVRRGEFTDHNGFYFVYTARGQAKSSKVYFWGKLNCIVKGAGGEWFKGNDVPAKQRGWYKDDIYVSDSNGGKFGDCNRVLVKGKITSCDGVGLAGVGVTITRGGTAISGSDGVFELVVHNFYEQQRIDKIFFNSGGDCVFLTCDCKDVPHEIYNDGLVPCVTCTERVYPVEVIRTLRSIVTSQKALKGGGRYGIGVVAADLAGRATFVGFIGYKDIPTFLETKSYSPVLLSWSIKNPLLKWPRDMKWLSFFRTSNLNFGRYLQWVGDKIEFLDAQGNITDSEGASKARVTIQSLNEFNKDNNFSTLTTYQFVKGDKVRIYDDGDGTLVDITNGFMDYIILGTNWNDVVATPTTDAPTTDGKSFIIPYDQRLAMLRKKNGFWIELIGQKDCSEKERYFEICGNIPIVDGLPQIIAGQLNTWDTYYQSRLIKVKESLGKTYGHPFESANVTDFWGEDVHSGGRETVRDALAVSKWYPDDTIKSDELVNEGRLNGLGTFRGTNRKPFKGQVHGGIVAAHAENNMIVFVCENDWFICDYNMKYARVTGDGLILTNLDNNLGEPYQKYGKHNGCAFEYTKSIGFFDDYGWWGDVKDGQLTLFSYKQSEDISAIDNKVYLTEKMKYIHEHNRQLPEGEFKDYFDLISGVDPLRGEIHFTFRPRRDKTPDVLSFINDEREIFIDSQETFIFSTELKKWIGWAGFTPESYAKMTKSSTGSDLITFAGGKPYSHNYVNAENYCEFYGIKTQRVQEFVANVEEGLVKVFKSITIEDADLLWFVDRIITSEPMALSYVPIRHFSKKEGDLYSRLLMDMNTYPPAKIEENFRSMLFDGKRIFGKWAKIRIVGDPKNLTVYNEIDNISVRISAAELTKK